MHSPLIETGDLEEHTQQARGEDYTTIGILNVFNAGIPSDGCLFDHDGDAISQMGTFIGRVSRQ